MPELTPDGEILELAIIKEIEANKFYTALAQRVTDPQMRKFFEELAGEELAHKEKLELEIIKTGRAATPTEDLELKADTDFHIPAGPLEITYKDMLVMAMQKEEASFRLYVDLVGRITDPNSRETLLALAQEEVRHKLRFETEYDLLLKKSK
jgi:rubrerythrin